MIAEACTGPVFSGSYPATDVIFLLKPVALATTDAVTKERLIQSGQRHYSEIISPESLPSLRYMRLYEEVLRRNAARLNADIGRLAANLDERAGGRAEVVLASLARAGTPIGVLLARALRRRGRATTHYSISIIRDRGLDPRAIAYILNRHHPDDIVFVDGWTGKGAIAQELRSSLAHGPITPFFIVVADPAGCADLAASTDDYAIPSGLLGGIVSGLISRTILNPEVVGEGDFHACQPLNHLAAYDLTQSFIADIEHAAPCPASAVHWNLTRRSETAAKSTEILQQIMLLAGITDANRIKLGIAESTRALLRRVPDRLFLCDANDEDVQHLVHLAGQHAVPIFPLLAHHPYRAIAVIKSLGNG